MTTNTWTVLRDRDAALYLTGVVISGFGTSALWLVSGVWVKDLTGSDGLAALCMLAMWAPTLAGPLLGALADRFPRKPLLITSSLFLAALLPVLLPVDSPGLVWLVLTVLFLYGATGVVNDAAEAALVATTLPAHLLADFNGLRMAITEGMKLVSPLAGAGLYTLYGGPAVVLLDAGTFVLAAGVYAGLRVRGVGTGEASGTGQPEAERAGGSGQAADEEAAPESLGAGQSGSATPGHSGTGQPGDATPEHFSNGQPGEAARNHPAAGQPEHAGQAQGRPSVPERLDAGRLPAAGQAVAGLSEGEAVGAGGVERATPGRSRRLREILSPALAGARYLWAHPRLRPLVLAGGVTMLCAGVNGALIYAVIDGLGHSPAFAGALYAVQGAGSVAVGLMSGRALRWLGERRFAAWGIGVTAVAVALRALPYDAVALTSSALIGAGLPCVLIAALTSVQRETPDELLGRTVATANTLVFAPNVIGLGVGAALVELADYQPVLVTLAAVWLAVSLPLLRGGVTGQRTEAEPARHG